MISWAIDSGSVKYPASLGNYQYWPFIGNTAYAKKKSNAVKTSMLSFRLDQNYPNPFNPSTTIKYEIPENGFVSLKVFNILGQEVASLVNEVKTAGQYQAYFNATKLSSGIYIYRLETSRNSEKRKMLLLK